MTSKIKALIADDHRIVRETVKVAIERVPQAEVVGEFDNGQQLCEAAKAIKPDLILLDISMPASKCGDTIRFLRRESPVSKIVVLTMHNEPAYLNLCLEAGVAGYVLKTASLNEVTEAIKTVLNGGVYIDPRLASNLAHRIQRTQNSELGSSRQLSDREQEVIRLAACGLTTKEIAQLIRVSEKSVETYKLRATEKLGLKTRTALLRYALVNGWLDDLHHTAIGNA